MMKPRILLIQTQAEGAGAQEISRLLGRGLEARGYDVHHLFLFRRTAAFDDVANAYFCARERPGGVWSLVRLLIRLTGHLRRLRPHAVLCFQHYGILIGAPFARLAGTRLIIANRTTATALMPAWLRFVDRVFGTLGVFSRIVVNSGSIEDEHRSHPRAYRNRLVRIDHGFEPKTSTLSRSEARAIWDLPEAAVILGCVARMHPLKNLGAAVRLLPGNERWHLALAGQGTEERALQALAHDLGCADRMHFVGELSPDAVGRFLRALDVFVFPSLAETFGLAVVEAAQAGVPVVANRLDVLREVLAIDGEPCALFVDADDTAAFATAVRRLVDDPGLAATLSARGARLKERYALDAMVDGYVALIEQCLRPVAAVETSGQQSQPSSSR